MVQSASQGQVHKLREDLHLLNTALTKVKKSVGSTGSRPSTSGRSTGSPQVPAAAPHQQYQQGQGPARELFQQHPHHQQPQQEYLQKTRPSTQAQQQHQEQQFYSSSHSMQWHPEEPFDVGLEQQQEQQQSTQPARQCIDNQLWMEQPQYQQQQALQRHLSEPCHHYNQQQVQHTAAAAVSANQAAGCHRTDKQLPVQQHQQQDHQQYQQQPHPTSQRVWSDIQQAQQQQQQQQPPAGPAIPGSKSSKQQQLHMQIAMVSRGPSRAASSDHLALLTASTDSSAQQKLDMARQAGHRMHQLVSENQDLRGTVCQLQEQLRGFHAATPGQPSPDAAELLLQNQTLHRELHVKEQAVGAAHAALRNIRNATEEQRLRELQEQVQELNHQLLMRDAALAAAEGQVKQLQHEKQQHGFRMSGSGRGSQEQADGGAGVQPTAGLLRQISGTLGVGGVYGEQQQQQLRQSTGGVSATSCSSTTQLQAALQKQLDQANDDLAKRAAEVGELRAQLQGMNEKHKAELRKEVAAHERQAELQQQRLEQTRGELERKSKEVERLNEELSKLQCQEQQQLLAGGCGEPQHRKLQEQLQQRNAEVEQMREALQQLHELMGCTSGSPRQYKGASVGNLVLALQRRLQQLLADITSRAAELDELKQQNAAQAPAAGGGSSSSSSGASVSNGSRSGGRVIRAGHDKQSDVEVAKELGRVRQRCKELEKEKQQYEHELADAARKLGEAEEHLGQVLVLQESNERLQQVLEQQKELVRTLQQHQQQVTQAAAAGPGSQAFGQLISELQQQLASAAVQLQQAKQVQERAIQQAEQYKRDLVEQRAQNISSSSSSEQHAGASTAQSSRAEVNALQQRCVELSQQVGGLQQQVAEHETKEARLHAVHAQLQEELCAMKVRAERWFKLMYMSC